jgi:hypothetical protein
LLAAPLPAVPAVLRSAELLPQNGASGTSALVTLAPSSRTYCRKHTTMLMNTVNL